MVSTGTKEKHCIETVIDKRERERKRGREVERGIAVSLFHITVPQNSMATTKLYQTAHIELSQFV